MAKTYTREELTNLTPEQFNALSKEEQNQVIAQGRAFREADIQKHR